MLFGECVYSGIRLCVSLVFIVFNCVLCMVLLCVVCSVV